MQRLKTTWIIRAGLFFLWLLAFPAGAAAAHENHTARCGEQEAAQPALHHSRGERISTLSEGPSCCDAPLTCARNGFRPCCLEKLKGPANTNSAQRNSGRMTAVALKAFFIPALKTALRVPGEQWPFGLSPPRNLLLVKNSFLI